MKPSILAAIVRPLTSCRPAVLDPAAGDGALLQAAELAVSPTAKTERLLGIGPSASFTETAPTRGARLHLWRSPLDPDAEALCDDVRWSWDCVVTRATTAAEAGARWAAIQRRLSKRGEGVLLATTPEAAAFLEKSADGIVWAVVKLPGGEAAFYFAADHKPAPGTPLEVLTPADDVELATACADLQGLRQRIIRGAVVEQPYHGSSQSHQRFAAARDEHLRRKGGRKAVASQYSVLMRDGALFVQLSDYQVLARDKLGLRVDDIHALHGKTPMELVVQRPTRLALQDIAKNPAARVHPAVQREIERCVMEYQAIRAPFIRLNDVQRLGYLDEEDSVKCVLSNLGDFTADRSYKMWTASEECTREEQRRREDGARETVRVKGMELVVKVVGDSNRTHDFRERPEDGAHSLPEFLQTFEIPDVPDVADLNPRRYAANVAGLAALER